MIPADHDRGFYFTSRYQIIENRTHCCPLAVSQPANACGQTLERDLVLRLLNPVAELLVLREGLKDRAVRTINVLRIARERFTAEWAFAFAEEPPVLFGDETGNRKSVLHAA